MSESKITSVLGVLCISLFVGLAGVFGQDALFEAPDFDQQLFDIDSVFIEPSELSDVTDALAALASNFTGDAKVSPGLRARALALGLRLNGVHRAANDALRKLNDGEAPEEVSGFDDPQSVVEVLWETAEALDVPDATRDDHLLSCYLMDIALRIDPEREGGVERFQDLALKGDFNGWRGVVAGSGGSSVSIPRRERKTTPDPAPAPAPVPPEGEPAPTPPAPSNNKVALARERGLGRTLVLDGAASTPSGRVAGLQASAIVGTLESPMGLRVLQEDGTEINGAAASVPEALTASGTGWPKNGGSLTITIEGNYLASNGEGVALPVALLVRSLIVDKDPVVGVVTVGAVGAKGETVGVKSLIARLRGVSGAEAPMVVVPAANSAQLIDLAVMGQMSPFVDHQLFTADTVEAAAGIAIEQSDDLKRARLLFGEVQDLSKKMAMSELISNTRVRTRLEKVLEFAPNHASARVLLAAGAGELPSKLTKQGAIYALSQVALPVLSVMESGEPVISDPTALSGTKSTLSKLRSKFDRKSAAVADSLAGLIEKIETYSRLNNRSSTRGIALLDEIDSAWQTLRLDYLVLRGERPPAPTPAPTPAEE